MQERVSGFGSRDFSGFDRGKWTQMQHIVKIQSHYYVPQSPNYARESELGYRYSYLIKLPYFDAPTMLVIDPMHNLFLCLAKHFIKKVFIDKQILNDFQLIQYRVDSMTVPSDIGRIPHKIQSSFSSFTTDLFKN